MRMKIDGENCTGHGRCAKYAPNVFRLDDDGYNIDRGGEIAVPAGEEDNAIKGMKSCPEKAISLVEG
jgi:ferredoxin